MAEGIDTFWGGVVHEAERQEDVAFKLKTQNALMESQLKNAMAIFDHQKASPEVGDAVFRMAGLKPTGKQYSVPELGLVEKGTVGIANANARAGGRGGADVDIPSLVEVTLRNPELYDTYDARTKARLAPHLGKRGFAYLGKIGVEKESLMNKAMSGITSIDAINGIMKESKGDYARYFAPGSVGARKLQFELTNLKDLVEKIRTGAASNSKEDVAYRTMIMPAVSELIEDMSDGQFDGEGITYRMNRIKSELQALSKNRGTAITKGKDSVANDFKAGSPLSGKTEETPQEKGTGDPFAGLSTDEKFALLVERRKKKAEAAAKAAKKSN